MAALILTDSQQVAFSIKVTDKKGNPASVEGVPEWASSDDTILTVEAAADGLSAVAKAAGPLGTAQVSVTADADLGTGVTSIIGTQDVEVVAGAAVAIALTGAAPEEQP